MEVFKPIKVENYQFMKNQYQFTLKIGKVSYGENRNFDLKNPKKKGFRISN